MTGQLLSVTDANGHPVTYAYDEAGRLVSQTDALGNTVSKGYDANSNVISTTDALGNTAGSITYDETNLPVKMSDALGNVVTYAYDSLERMTKKTNPLEQTTSYSYDDTGRMTAVTNALNGISSYTYDKDGNQTAVTDPMGVAVKFTYDLSDRLTSKSTVSGGTVRYGYNALNLLSELTNARGQKREYIYDDDGRIASYTDKDGTTSYTYDANGNVLTVTDTKGTITREYDANNRVKKYTDVYGNVIQYTYDTVGNLASITYPDGKEVNYAYDAVNRLEKVTDLANRSTEYSYDANGNLVQTKRPDGSILTQTYDKANRLTDAVDTASNGTVINNYSYTYDANGQVTKETSSYGGVTSVITYDELGRLVSRADTVSEPVKDSGYKDSGYKDSGIGNASYSYTYDASGNITGDGLKYDGNNRLTEFNGMSISYDEDGNMTGGPLGNSSAEFSYDFSNRLIQAGNAFYEYDAEGNRILSNVGNDDYTYAYDTNHDLSRLLVRTDSNGNSTYYVYGMGLIGEESANGYNVYHYDLRGSTTAITSLDGIVTDRYTYGAYGELTGHTGDSSTPFLYNGRDGVMTDSNGLYYMRARYYSPELKRFINEDPVNGSINDSRTLNKYAYANGNPISLIDPFGTSAELQQKISTERSLSGFSNIGSSISSWLQSIFGAGYTNEAEFDNHIDYPPAPWPIRYSIGSTQTNKLSTSGDTSKPISVYAKSVNGDFTKSSAGYIINIGSESFKYSAGFSDLGYSRSFTNGNNSNDVSFSINLSEFRAEISSSTTTERNSNESITSYNKITVDGWLIAAAYVYAETGVILPSPQISYQH